jgi:hypothetical protein
VEQAERPVVGRRRVQTPGPSAGNPRGISLLEVILALAILAGALVVLGELVRIGTRAGSGARDLTRAHLLCESIMSEVLAGAVELDPVRRVEMPGDPDWLYSIGLATLEEEGLVALEITVEENTESRKHRLTYSLVRWIPDPGIEIPEEVEEDEEEEDTEEDTSGDDGQQPPPGSDSGNGQGGDNGRP